MYRNSEIRLKAMAKINLGLDVVRRREDGYHEVKMIMQNVYLYDDIVIVKKSEPGITVKTNLSFLPTNEDNLIYKAAKLLMDEFEIEEGVEVTLTKRIPVAAGMAGGSTDAAATMVGVNRIFNLGLTKQNLMDRGVKIGADVPYCIMRGTALSEGIGEILTELPRVPRCKVLIAKPQISVSTKFVYQNLKLSDDTVHPDIDGMIDAIKEKDIRGIANRLGNVLETVTIPQYPVISDIKNKMIEMGAMNSLMSGSGSTVFGLFDDEEKARNCYAEIKNSGLAKQVFLTDFYNPGEKHGRN